MAKTNIFLKLEGIEGEVAWMQDHKGWIEMQSFAWGVDATTDFSKWGRGSGVGRPRSTTSRVTNYADKSSVKLWKNCMTGKAHSRGQHKLLETGGETRDRLLQN